MAAEVVVVHTHLVVHQAVAVAQDHLLLPPQAVVQDRHLMAVVVPGLHLMPAQDHLSMAAAGQ